MILLIGVLCILLCPEWMRYCMAADCFLKYLYCARVKKVSYNFVVPTKKQLWGFPKKIGISQFSFFVQALFPCSTSLRRPLVLNTIGDL